jgi:hypothetical protein
MLTHKQSLLTTVPTLRQTFVQNTTNKQTNKKTENFIAGE